MAGGLPVSDLVADQAAEWLTVLMADDVSDEDRQRWQQWREAHPDHERVWRHIEAVTGRLKKLQPEAAYKALSAYADSAPHSPARRKAIKLLLWGGIATSTGLLATRGQSWSQLADYHTSTGEQRTVMLDDGTHITLNTASAINVRFDDQQRVVRLVSGEVMVVTGHLIRQGLADTRPFIIETHEGSIRALGTRFTVRQRNDQTSVAVLESAVEITLDDPSAPPRRLQAGERVSFTRTVLDTPTAVDDQDSAWTRGQIIADNVRLGDFMADLSRYRPGLLRCDPAVADLHISGVFPLQDTDRILTSLHSVLPVQVQWRTRYWVTVTARA